MYKNRCFIILLLSCYFSWAQVTNEGAPESWKHDLEQINPILLPKFDLDAQLAEDEINDEEAMPYRFGYTFETNHHFNNSGTWTELPNGDRVWRIRFHSKDALTLNFLLEDFYLPKNAKIYLYNQDRTQLIGAYDEQQNNDDEILSTWLVEGDDVWIEYYEPNKVKDQGRMTISKVVHGYRSQSQFKTDKALNDSGNCNQDVDCPIGDMDEVKDVVKKSVALMLVNNASFCTGSLVNNTEHDATPYFLSANHCFTNPANIAFRFNWISPDPVCATTANSTQNTNFLTISGATLRARRFQTDFFLMEINNSIPDDWDVVWAGWDRSDDIPSRSFGVHHPSGDIMKVARDDNSPGQLTQNGPQGGEPVWRIFSWDLGVTEPGSSGSALFNEEGQIIGQLWRGIAACSGTVDNNGWDEYGRFGISWDAGGNSTNQLKDWLDPNDTGETSIGPFPAQEDFNIDLAVDVEGFDNFCTNSVSPEIILSNQGNEPITSATIEFSLNEETPNQINWTGNLMPEETEVITTQEFTLNQELNTFSVEIDVDGDENPTNDEVVTEFQIEESVGSSQLVLTINLDQYPEETTWEIINAEGSIIFSGGPYSTEGGTVNEDLSLPDDDCYTFSIFDDFGDGICCGFGDGNYLLATDDGVEIASGGEFETSESTTFNNFITLSNESFDLNTEITLYPNPTTGITYLNNNSGNTINYQIFNITGKLIGQGKASHQKTRIDFNAFSRGVYLIKMIDETRQVSSAQKIIVK